MQLHTSHPFIVVSCECLEEGVLPSQQPFPFDAKKTDGSSGDYVAVLWALEPECEYCVSVRPSGGDESVQIVMKTKPILGPMAMCPSSAVIHPYQPLCSEFLECVRAQKENYMFVEKPTNSVEEFLMLLFYHSLFALPSKFRGIAIFVLPNGKDGRFCIDLRYQNIEWRKNKKVRRLLASNQFKIAVNRNIRDSLRLAQKYHSRPPNSTWLHDEYIALLAEMAKSHKYGVHIVCIELLEKGTDKVMAGCLGYALGSVYHDFTMFTLARSAESFGTVLTKLLGESLQKCGYDLWYWGLRIEYMKQFEEKYGGRCIPKPEFLQRWAQYRDVQPACRVDEYICSGKAFLPHAR
ncbi:Leucyl/phenylalanyl-tRNA-protein transferase [Trypanosoma melophagium]|uniref:Leucyl/phenylalanyl-tRNA-protein transferase n=1 Tax=Trypanosoma melophagium TaxID=715481 RepID=UPI00351A7095|nr:Leucyl/phenylalanyl-tRNA-protein transferase [Trypanosoma melophagium]